MTHSRIQEVLQIARDNYDCLASLSDAIALLDMCHCFADNVASSRMPWCRPSLSDSSNDMNQDDNSCGSGAIAIRNGRYAIDVTSNGANSRGGEFVPNDCYSSALQNFTVITGINGAGKSTYLVRSCSHHLLVSDTSLRHSQYMLFFPETNCSHCHIGSLWKLCTSRGSALTYP